ncbi:hypothetical protein [[Actinomadura] parvosata]|uniref:hypothetical protein n=1 Tax=[Actinomadura] parvosata TaxID=1955412 RepID=UPI0018AD1D2A|nr:hypothetical protein [Nonomuraea sp. ATCC 55076]
MTPLPSLGLRARLLSAFALLCVVTAVAVAGGLYVLARNEILRRTQDAAVESMRDRLETLYPLRTLTPNQEELGMIAATASDNDSPAIAIQGETHSPLPRRHRETCGREASGAGSPTRSHPSCGAWWPKDVPRGSGWHSRTASG